MKRATRAGAVLMLTAASIRSPGAIGQQIGGNPVLTAVDAFGLTVGLESVGIYSPASVRDFDPQAAGNVRIDGLYFDQQAPLSDRVVDRSTIFVGLSETGYAFPAPTGIVDYDLRHPTGGGASATLIAQAGPFENRGLSLDASLPLVAKKLQLPLGIAYQAGAPIPGGGSIPGYTSTIISAGAVPQWTPNDRLTVRGLFDWTGTSHARTLPTVFTAGNYLPPPVPRHFLGQGWALNRYTGESYGLTVVARLDRIWSLAAGLFRSVSDTPVSYADLYLDTRRNGLARHF